MPREAVEEAKGCFKKAVRWRSGCRWAEDGWIRAGCSVQHTPAAVTRKGEEARAVLLKKREWRCVGRGTLAGTAAAPASPGRILLSRTGCAQVWGVAAAPWFPLRYPSRTEHRPLARGKGTGVRGVTPPAPNTSPSATPGVPYPWMMASPPGGSGCWHLLWAPRRPSRGW